jgi:hypothetical protein
VATTSSVDIFGEYVVSFAGSKVMELSEDFTIFVIASEKLAESYRNWWKMLWDLLPNAS